MKYIVIMTELFGQMPCFGHELHISRCILIDMLLKHYITENATIVTLEDRKFLYKKTFKNLLNLIEFRNLKSSDKIKEYNIISLKNYSHLACGANDTFPNFKFSENYYSDSFKNKMLQIEYCETNYDKEYKGDYVVLHHRYNDNVNNLKNIVKKVNEIYGKINIIIFNNNIDRIKKEFSDNDTNLLFIDNLQLYASYLNGYNSKNKCKLFITEWSGGGQLSQYCCDSKIFIYFNEYSQSSDYVDRLDKLLESAKSGSYFDDWDFKNPINAEIKMFYNLDHLLENIDKHI